MSFYEKGYFINADLGFEFHFEFWEHRYFSIKSIIEKHE